MATPIRLKRSSVTGKRPVLNDLQIGELALNFYDGYLWAKRDTGGVGIGTTIALLTPWTENFGAGSIYYNNLVGIGTNTPLSTLDVNGTLNITGVSTFKNRVIFNSTNSIQIPVGTTAQRDEVGVAVTGQIRYNSEYSTFEGYGPGGQWGSLGGVKDIDGNTYIIPETSPGANENILYFYNDGSLTATISTTTSTFYTNFAVSGVSTFNNHVVLTGELRGPSEFIIDPAAVGNNTGRVRIKGDLLVDGTQTIINSETITLGDFIVGIASTATTDLLADGAGIQIGPDNTLLYDHANTALKSSENFNLAVGKTYKINGTDLLSSTQLTIANINASGVSTIGQANITTANISAANIVSGIVTTLNGTNLNYTGVGTIGQANITTANISGANIVSGIVTTLNGTNLNYSGVGTITQANITTANISGANIVSGIVTTLNGTNLNYSGVGTIAQANITTANISGANVVAGIVTTLNGTNLNYSGVGTIAQANITTANISGANIVSGIVTTLNGTNLNYSGVGTIAQANITTANISGANVVAGIVTTLNGTNLNYSGVGTIGQANITTANILGANIVSGVVTTISGTNLNYSGVGTIGQANITTANILGANIVAGVVTTLNGTNLNYTGVGTIGQANVTTANISTARIVSGIVTTISGTNLNYSGVGTIGQANITTANISGANIVAGVVTTISGTNLSYSGVGTFSTRLDVGTGVTIGSGVVTATTRLSTGNTGVGINITTNTISGPSELVIDPAGVGDNTGAVRIRGDLFVDGTQTYINSTAIELADFNVGIATTVGTNALLDGAGIGIGSTGIRKTITWNNTAGALTSSEDWNLVSGKQYEINGISVLNSTTLGSGVVNSSLTSVGVLGQLQVTGISTFTDGPVFIGSATSTGTAGQDLQVTGGAYVSGNLGVGRTNPSALFHLTGGSAIGAIIERNTTGESYIRYQNSSGTMHAGISTAATFWGIGDSTNFTNSPYFAVTNTTGNVGIATTNPTSKLHVVGDVLISGIVTATTYDTTFSRSGSITASTSSISQVGIHSLSTTTYRSVEYIIQATQSTNYHIVKILAIHDGSIVYLTEYGSQYNNSAVATYDVDISGGNMRLLVTPASASSTTFKVNFTSIVV